MNFFCIGQNPALVFLTLLFSVKMKIIIELNGFKRKAFELPYLVLTWKPIREMRDVIWEVLKHKEKRPLCPRRCCTHWHWKHCPLKVSWNLPCIFTFCLFQVLTRMNSVSLLYWICLHSSGNVKRQVFQLKTHNHILLLWSWSFVLTFNVILWKEKTTTLLPLLLLCVFCM